MKIRLWRISHCLISRHPRIYKVLQFPILFLPIIPISKGPSRVTFYAYCMSFFCWEIFVSCLFFLWFYSFLGAYLQTLWILSLFYHGVISQSWGLLHGGLILTNPKACPFVNKKLFKSLFLNETLFLQWPGKFWGSEEMVQGNNVHVSHAAHRGSLPHTTCGPLSCSRWFMSREPGASSGKKVWTPNNKNKTYIDNSLCSDYFYYYIILLDSV